MNPLDLLLQLWPPNLLDLYFNWTQARAEEWIPQFDQFVWFPLMFGIALWLLCLLLISGVSRSMESWVPPLVEGLSAGVSFVFLLPELLVAYSWKKVLNAKLPQALYNYGDSIIWIEGKVNAFVAGSAAWVKKHWKAKWLKTLMIVLACVLLLHWNSGQCGGVAADSCMTPAEAWWFGNLWPLLVEAWHSMPK